LAGCSSVNALAALYAGDGLLARIAWQSRITQPTLSRFLTGFTQWNVFNAKRTARLQEDPDTALKEGDVIALDDSHVPHPYAKTLPFLYWLYDHSQKVYIWAMNLVVLHVVCQNGMEYPWSYAIWTKSEDGTASTSKLDLAADMLRALRQQVSCRLWVVMDRWYFSKPFLRDCESLQLDWVTKAKRNTQLFRRIVEPATGRERFVPVQPRDLIRLAYPKLMVQTGVEVASAACADIFLKMPTPTTNRKGETVVKMKYTRVAAVVGKRVRGNDVATEQAAPSESSAGESPDEQVAEFKGAYLLLSNRHDAPGEVLKAWLKRWRIEVLFRAAKQDLGMLTCHSPSVSHAHAHLTLLFTAETLVRYLVWKDQKAEGQEDGTHGQVIRQLLCIRCRLRQVRSTTVEHPLTIHLDIVANRFATLIRDLWPPTLELGWFAPQSSKQYLGSTA
jgi:hypothetical protein